MSNITDKSVSEESLRGLDTFGIFSPQVVTFIMDRYHSSEKKNLPHNISTDTIRKKVISGSKTNT